MKPVYNFSLLFKYEKNIKLLNKESAYGIDFLRNLE